MKRLFIILILLLIIIPVNIHGQTARNSWSFGFGFSYPRFQSTDVRPQQGNYGGHIFLQRYFSENVSLKLKASYLSMEGRIPGNRFFYTNGTVVPSVTEYMRTNVIGGDLDVLYNLSPCSPVSPYLGLGIGVISFTPDWPENVVNNEGDKNDIAGQINFVFGSEWVLSDKWEAVTEFGYHTLTGKLDGITTTNRVGVLGSFNDSYIDVSLGFNYYFSKGEKSQFCDLYEGITAELPQINYPSLEQIEDVIKRYSTEPAEVDYNRIEDIVKKYRGSTATADNWVLFGVNFDFNKSTLAPEAYPILDHALEMLRENQNLRVEIQGHTDNIGSDEYNQRLSEARAAAVKDYLVKNGIDAARLTTRGMGESKPVADNNTEAGRAQNRRVEFNVSK